MLALIWLVPLLPLLGAAFLGLFGRRLRLSERVVGLVACGVVGASFVVATAAVIEYGTTRWDGEHYTVYRSSEAGDSFPHRFEWIPGGTAVKSLGDDALAPADLTVDWLYQVDALTAVMLLVVTGVGFLIHIFATGYMHGDKGFYRFFSYMNLFMFSMLVLVLAANLPMLFVGWEGVGLCSYLLIGYYIGRQEAGDAAKKAFIANRIGDAGFLLAMFGLFALFGTMDIHALRGIFENGGAAQYQEALGQFGLMGMISLGLLVGVTGKSAQIPLYVWLPDAMAGPTPVSALIHAATMVTAGVYLLTRLNFIIAAAPTMMLVIALVGVFTALLSASIALTQNDIKKVLAYSTVSQLGFMVAACGVGAFAMAIFHLFTHAFFKALLFLAAGSVIHAMHHEQDLRNMGGLRRSMPITFKTTVVGALAISGVFPLAGFFSKDGILSGVFGSHTIPHEVTLPIGAMLFVVAGMTAFYTTRLVAMAFYGEPRGHHHDAHESPRSMTVPLVGLAALSVVGGWLGISAVFPLIGSHTPPFAYWLAPVIETGGRVVTEHGVPAWEYALVAGSAVWSVLWVWLGWVCYVRRPELPERMAKAMGGLYWASLAKFKVDEAYGVFPIGFVVALAKLAQRTDARGVDGAVDGIGSATRGGAVASGFFDRWVVDGLVNATGLATYFGSLLLRSVQSGLVQNYALVIVAALLAFIALFQWQALNALVQRLVS
jgi:NADH-quinone oxidoreductase subunit L